MLDRAVKYSLHWTELNNFKARITERLVKRYIEKALIPALRAESWDQIIFTPNTWFGDEVEQNKNRPKHLQIFWKNEEQLFIKNSCFPTEDFLKSFKKLTKVLKNCPDGFLVKLRKTGHTKLLKEALSEFSMAGCVGWNINFPLEHDENEQLPVVKGEIEIVEIKTGKAIVPAHQMTNYRKVLEEKYQLRFFHVNIISFEKNEFEIEEKLVTTPLELEAVQLQERKEAGLLLKGESNI